MRGHSHKREHTSDKIIPPHSAPDLETGVDLEALSTLGGPLPSAECHGAPASGLQEWGCSLPVVPRGAVGGPSLSLHAGAMRLPQKP